MLCWFKKNQRDKGMQDETLWTVASLAEAVQDVFIDRYGYLKVVGELSSFKKHTSGHLYFSLKEKEHVLDGVCWRSAAKQWPKDLEIGEKIQVTGRLTTYSERSKYQVVAVSAEKEGEGEAARLFQALKQQLIEEGLFDQSRKRPLPRFPEIIGLITSPTGAVLQDMKHRLEDRFPCVKVKLYPVLVQGEKAPEEIERAFHYFAGSQNERPDVLILARGGGSAEDLAAFNTERVVRAIANSSIPVVSAIGHETDQTLADCVADYRAPTPTAAIESVVPARAYLKAWLKDTLVLCHVQTKHLWAQNQWRYRHVSVLWSSLQDITGPHQQRLDDKKSRLDYAYRTLIQQKQQRFLLLSTSLSQKLSFLKTLRHFHGEQFVLLKQRMQTGLEQEYQRRKTFLDLLFERLFRSSHKKRLQDGFAVVRHDQGHVVSYGDFLPGDTLWIEMEGGSFKAMVVEKRGIEGSFDQDR